MRAHWVGMLAAVHFTVKFQCEFQTADWPTACAEQCPVWSGQWKLKQALKLGTRCCNMNGQCELIFDPRLWIIKNQLSWIQIPNEPDSAISMASTELVHWASRHAPRERAVRGDKMRQKECLMNHKLWSPLAMECWRVDQLRISTGDSQVENPSWESVIIDYCKVASHNGGFIKFN